VRIGSHSSAVTSRSVVVPQGSVLGPLLFSIHVTYFRDCSLLSHTKFISSSWAYADNTQLYLALSHNSYTHDISTLQSCLDSLHIWLCENGLALNASKSVVVLFGTSQRLKSLSGLSGLKSVNVAGTVIPVSDKVKILGATLDSNLTMKPHTKTLSSSCFYHIRSLKQIRSSLDDSMAGSVASSLVSSRLEC